MTVLLSRDAQESRTTAGSTQKPGVLEQMHHVTAPAPRGKGHAEGIGMMPVGEVRSLVVAFDSPSQERLKETLSVIADLLPLP